MSGTKRGNKKRTDKARASIVAKLRDFDPQHVVLPPDEIRIIALLSSTRNGVEPFVRQMVSLSESLKAGRASKLAQLARQSKDQSLAELVSPMSQAIKEGRIIAVQNTAFYAASYAYQNSLDYARELLNYLNRFGRRATHG